MYFADVRDGILVFGNAVNLTGLSSCAKLCSCEPIWALFNTSLSNVSWSLKYLRRFVLYDMTSLPLNTSGTGEVSKRNKPMKVLLDQVSVLLESVGRKPKMSLSLNMRRRSRVQCFRTVNLCLVLSYAGDGGEVKNPWTFRIHCIL